MLAEPCLRAPVFGNVRGVLHSLSAPGKLFLAGEYAVLWGGSARILGVGPRGWATARQRDDERVLLMLAEGWLRGRRTRAGVQWETPVGPGFTFAARAVELSARALGGEGPGLELALSASTRAPGGAKLGLGSSARATVLAVEACRRALAGQGEAHFEKGLEEGLKVALAAHASAQRGQGSGGDVAASFLGGGLRYRRFGLEGLPEETAEASEFAAWVRQSPPVLAEPLPPTGLTLLFASSGQSASTPKMVSGIEAANSEAARERFVRASDLLGAQFEAAFVDNDLTVLREVCEALSALLRTLGPIETPALEEMMRVARALGAAAKVSGAGGGDGCLLFCDGTHSAERVTQALQTGGALVLPVTVEPGRRVEPAAPPELVRWHSGVDTSAG